jgi:hypothetical protein
VAIRVRQRRWRVSGWHATGAQTSVGRQRLRAPLRTFDRFSKSLRLALEVVGDAAKPALIERIGLRYIDLIRPRPNESWTAYLKQGLHGLSPQAIGMTKGLQRHETDQVMTAMWELHENLDVSFRDAVTEHALNQWQAQSL